MAGRLPTRGQEHAGRNERREHDGEQEPPDDRAFGNRGGSDGMEVGEQHADQSSGRSYAPFTSGVSIR
jgi:hypothetical protein